ncbi:MAG: NAD-dependent epimerase/dehydratase family protein [Candidatus Krumholzibacteria bacterium]
MSKGPAYLVTGASGFVGRSLCRRLYGAGRVRALLRRPGEGPWHEAVFADLEMNSPLDEAVAGVDTVFHLAGKAHDLGRRAGDAGGYDRLNVEGTARLLRAAGHARVARFVFLSSVKAMGEGGNSCLSEDAAAEPQSPYGRSKRRAEIQVLEDSGIPHRSVLRSTLVYGSGAKGNLARMIRAMERGLFPPIPHAHNRRSMVHVDDLVDALLLAAEKPEANGRVFIVSDGRDYSTRELYEWICEAMHRRVPPWTVPVRSLRVLARLGDGCARVLGRPFPFDSAAFQKLLGSACYDSALIRKTLGYHSTRSLKDEMPDIVASLRAGTR